MSGKQRIRDTYGSRRGSRLTSVAILAYVISVATTASAARYYVNPGGSDADPGTSSSPWRTISHAVGVVASGDTVVLADGTYAEQVKLDALANGGQPITFMAQNPGKAVIDANGAYYCVGADGNATRGVILSGLLLQNGAQGIYFPSARDITISGCQVTGCQEAIRMRDGSGLTIMGSTLWNNLNGVIIGVKGVSGVQGVRIEQTSSGITTQVQRRGKRGTVTTVSSDAFVLEGMCTGVVIRDCVGYGASDTGFDLKPSDVLVERCRAYSNLDGFKLWGANVVMLNCLIYGNSSGGALCASDNLQFWNCTFGSTGVEGLRLETPNVASCAIRNTIFYNSQLRCLAGGMPNEDYNCYYASSGAVISTTAGSYSASEVQAGTAPTGTHDIGLNPLFVNASSDFHLTGSSPCIGAGLYSSLVSVDYYGKQRLNPPDIGAVASSFVVPIIVPTDPTSAVITNGPSSPENKDLEALASGSTAASGTVSYSYQWAVSGNGGATWGAWGYAGQTLPKGNLVAGQLWKAHARATVDGVHYSGWVESATCTITAVVVPPTPAPPTAVTISPSSPSRLDTLTATAVGGGDGTTTPTYQYQWAGSVDGGSTWSTWGWDGRTLAPAVIRLADTWKCHARVVTGTAVTDWVESQPVQIRRKPLGG